MFFIETRLSGSYIVSMEEIGDSRGSFSRAWCKREMECYGLDTDILQCNMSYNAKAGTLRGMHFQKEPFSETKYIRCMKGSFYDVIIDLREDSLTFGEWIGVELSEKNGKALYVPRGFAHGYLTLEDNTVAYYQVTEFYNKESEAGVRWDDKKFNIKWPLLNELIISEKDRNWPLFQE